MHTFISVEEARQIIFSEIGTMPVVGCTIEEAWGHTLAEPIVSRDAIPPFPNSGMDGYAVIADDFNALPARLQVVDEIPAGSVSSTMIHAGTCAKIMTGAPVPAGATAVVPVEWVHETSDSHVVFNRAPQPGANIRKAGQDVAVGESVIAAGKTVTPFVSGMLATIGQAHVRVHRRPRVAVIATGDELIAADEPLTPGKIRNSSGIALRGQVRLAGAQPVQPLLARDNVQSIRETVEAALEADVLVFAGGVSVGDYDLVKNVLDDMGMKLLFWKVRQRPGKPLAFGILEGKPVFGLPGNPVSSAICFDQYVRPALYRMTGRKELFRPKQPAVLKRKTAKVKGLHFFARGIAMHDASGMIHVEDTGPQGSNLYSSMVKANSIIHLNEDLEEAPAGLAVQIEWLTL